MANRLELTWIGKENRPRVEPRVLLEDSSKSFHAPKKVSESDHFDNRLIFGDNLLGLKALEQEFAGRIRCVFIDPPYNTGSAFEHYEDGLEHSIWLSMMRDRLEIMRRLMSDDGSLWITIDDNEAHYLKVLCDEVFGRPNFVANVVWQKVYSARMDAKAFSTSHDHILVYRKTERFVVPRIEKEQDAGQFNFKDPETGRFYRRRSLRKEGSSSLRADRPNLWYALTAPDGTRVFPVKPSGVEGNWRWGRATYDRNSLLKMVEWVKVGERWEVYVKQFKAQEGEARRPPETIWFQEEVGHNHEAKQEAQAFNAVDVFATPKPERLLQRIVTLATNPGDWILDSFAGSGTTGAVAHKMGRRWIMVELGEHCHTHIIPRLSKVIEGKDDGGITQATGWKGGGGFRFYNLAPSLLAKDEFGNWVVNRQYNGAMLAEAVCKLEGYHYSPSPEIYWQHGHSSEDSFLYVTTQTLLVEQLRRLNEEVGPKRSLLICCGSFTAKDLSDFPRLTVKKIPKAVLHRCEWDHDDYSLEIRNLPEAPATSSPPAPSGPLDRTKGKESRRRTVTLLSYGEP